MARRQAESDSSDDDRSSGDGSEDEEEDSEVEEEEEEEEAGEEQEEEEDGVEDEAKRTEEAKHLSVETDLAEIRKMVDEMSKIKMRLQFRMQREQDELLAEARSLSKRRSSVEDIVIPASVCAAVQTIWDMPRVCDMEKIVSAPENSTSAPAGQYKSQHETGKPVNKSVQLSLQDLARSYGVEDAVFGGDTTTRRDAIGDTVDANATTRPGSAGRQNSRTWDQPVPRQFERNAPDSSQTTSTRPKLDRSQLLSQPLDEMGTSSQRPPSPAYQTGSPLEDSFGSPVSPTNSSQLAASGQVSPPDKQGKTVEQREMEAMKSLLFF